MIRSAMIRSAMIRSGNVVTSRWQSSGLRRSAGGSLPRICDLGPVLRKVDVRERVQGCRSE
jgi:hypothetical protein